MTYWRYEQLCNQACDEIQIVADLSTPTGYRDALEAAYAAGWHDAEKASEVTNQDAKYTPGPKLGEWYKAGDLPAGSVVSATTRTEYVIGRSRCCMRWEQPIPGSEGWRVRYEGRLPQGVWMTHRERAEVDEVRNPPLSATTEG